MVDKGYMFKSLKGARDARGTGALGLGFRV